MENDENEPKFPQFPYTPYPIQLDFMKSLYRSLDKGGVSMLESPTGTGKTLSSICSSLQWVYDQRQKDESKTKVEANQSRMEDGQIGSDDEPDWMKNFVVNKDVQKQDNKLGKKRGLGKFDEIRNRKDDKENLSRVYEEGDCHLKKGEVNLQKNDERSGVDLSDEEFLLEDYKSEDEDTIGNAKSKRKVSELSLSSSSDEEEEKEKDLKIYFCSRTHSQLSQFIKELRTTKFDNNILAVCLGSRKNFCINEEVLKLANTTRINERCLELQKNKKKEVSKIKNIGSQGKSRRTRVSCGCPMLRKQKLQKQFRNEMSEQGALDIEDLVNLGRSIGTCPYYASRSMVPAADLVVLPYQSLLSKSSREILGLNLKNNIVIIDEAHKLADSLINMHDSKITFHCFFIFQLKHVHFHIEKYLARFRNLLGPGNRRYIQTLMVVTRALLLTLSGEKDLNHTSDCQVEEKTAEMESVSNASMAINDFLFSLNIDNINLVKLLQYIKESNIIHKVSGYGEKVASLQKDMVQNGSQEYGEDWISLSSFQALVGMLISLTNTNGDGRIIISNSRSRRQGGYLKYVMLTREKIFSEIVDEARAVILAGGTLQPIEETRERLFPWLPTNQLHFFSCSHIVPPESILPMAVSRGPSGRLLDFSYGSRSSINTELGLLVCNLVAVVPEGIVVFFSSFEYEEKVYNAWKTSGILERIVKKKRVFREPRKASDAELVLKEYKEIIDGLPNKSKEVIEPHNGAMLLAVVGGKISEGINFSDGMGRCIVMVGLPYSSPSDIELIERIKYIESLGDLNSAKTPRNSLTDEYFNGDIHTAFSILRSCKRRGLEYYENLCMKAVNQSIGRAIRHINDYAAILLVDKRYCSDTSKQNSSHPTSKLPQWIKDRLVCTTNSYGEVHRQLHHFFKFNKTKETR